MSDVEQASVTEEQTIPLSWRIVLAVVFALLFGWFEFTAVSNLVALPQLYRAQGYAELVPWATLVVGAVVPPVLFVAALLLGRARALSTRVLVFAAGLAATAATALALYIFA